MEIMIGLMIVAIFLMFYFIPSIIAVIRKHPNCLAIVLLNFLLGWTMLGWFFSLIWSFKDPGETFLDMRESKNCPFCAESIRVQAVYCRFCHKDL